MAQQYEGTFVEGIGDDVIIGVVLFLAAVVPVFIMWFVYRAQLYAEQVIHPQSETAVQDVRQHLREQNRPANVQTGRQSTRAREGEMTCPICIGDATFAIETNCGHKFCGQCVTTYWRHGNWLGAISCPVCRQSVTILLLLFSEAERQENSEEKAEIVQQINRYNRRFSGQPVPWLDYIRDLPTILRHCVQEFFSVDGLVWMYRLRIIVLFVLALLYFISPLDIIPEAVFGFLGLIDDLFILLLLGIYVSIIYRRFVADRATRQTGGS